MSMLKVILEDIQIVRAYGNSMLEHCDYGLWFRQPSDGTNPIAWQVGHMAIAQFNLCLGRVRGIRDSDEGLLPIKDYARLFGKGSVPSSNPSDYPTPEAIRAAYDAVFEQVIREVAELDEAILPESCGATHPMFSTKEGALRFAPKHEMLHVGQIGLLRRLFDLESLR